MRSCIHCESNSDILLYTLDQQQLSLRRICRKKAKTVPSSCKWKPLFLCDYHEIISIDYSEKSTIITGNILRRYCIAWKLRPKKNTYEWFIKMPLPNIIALTHTSAVVVAKLIESGLQLVQHPPILRGEYRISRFTVTVMQPSSTWCQHLQIWTASVGSVTFFFWEGKQSWFGCDINGFMKGLSLKHNPWIM